MNGIILVDKPKEWTSHDVVAKLRGILHERRIGHSGTLDPMATGLLVVFVGRATRAVQFAESDEKEYYAKMRCGIVTNTQDITGEAIEESGKTATSEQLLSVIPKFLGEIEQIPPMYSAVKVGGKKLYELARQGVEIERKSRKITIHEIEYLGMDGEDFCLRILCSKGTYIRTLVNDIGQELGTGATLTDLRRTKAGVFTVNNAKSIEQIAKLAENGNVENAVISVDMLFENLPKYIVNAAQYKKCLCGNSFKADLTDGDYRVYSDIGEFLMIGACENGLMKTVKSFFEVK